MGVQCEEKKPFGALIVNGLEPDEACSEANKLRKKLIASGLDTNETRSIAEQIARDVAVYGDIPSQMEKLKAGPHKSEDHTNAARLEYNALMDLESSKRATRFTSGSTTGMVETLSHLNRNQALDRPVDIQELTEQITNQLHTLVTDNVPIKERMAMLAIANQQIGQQMLKAANQVKTAEGAAAEREFSALVSCYLGMLLKRNLEQTRSGCPDLMAAGDCPTAQFLNRFAIEVKHHSKPETQTYPSGGDRHWHKRRMLA